MNPRLQKAALVAAMGGADQSFALGDPTGSLVLAAGVASAAIDTGLDIGQIGLLMGRFSSNTGQSFMLFGDATIVATTAHAVFSAGTTSMLSWGIVQGGTQQYFSVLAGNACTFKYWVKRFAHGEF